VRGLTMRRSMAPVRSELSGEPDVLGAAGGAELTVVDGVAESLLGVGQQDGEGWSFGVFKLDPDGVAVLRYPDVGD